MSVWVVFTFLPHYNMAHGSTVAAGIGFSAEPRTSAVGGGGGSVRIRGFGRGE